MKPTAIELRAPTISSETMSRPRLSVPSQCARRRRLQLVRDVDARRPDTASRRSDSSARATSSSATSTPPITKLVVRAARGRDRSSCVRACSRGSITAYSTSTTKLMTITAPRAASRRCAPRPGRGCAIAWKTSRPRPGRREHVLDHDRAGEQVGELQAHDGQHRDEGVAQHVAPQHLARWLRPLARAVRTKSSRSTSSTAERVMRARIAACTTASATAGSSSALQAGPAAAAPPSRESRRPRTTAASPRTPGSAGSRTRSSGPRCRAG